MTYKLRYIIVFSIASLVLFAGCGDTQNGKTEHSEKEPASAQNESGLTEFQLEHGIGPITEEIVLGEPDPATIEQGKTLFKTKCSACHKVDQQYIGPNMGTVLEKRSPTYVMNMILNPDGMVKEHPEAKKMLQEFLSPMPNQNLTGEEARAILEYLASVQTDTTKQ